MSEVDASGGFGTVGGVSGASSRESAAGAGWECEPGKYRRLLTKRDLPFGWLNPAPLWQSRTDRLVRWFGDQTNDRRRLWMKALPPSDPDQLIEAGGSDGIAFLVLGDTGEGDASQ